MANPNGINNTTETPNVNTNSQSQNTSSGGSVLGALFGGIFNLISQGIQFAHQKKLQQRDYENQMAAWNATNEYNTPAAQIERLKEAGLNPNLAYGNGAAGGSASSAPSMKMPTAPDYTGSLNSAIQLGQYVNQSVKQIQELQNMRTIDKLNKATEEKANADKRVSDMQYNTMLWKYNNLLPLESKKMRADIQNLIGRNILLSLQSQGQSIKNDMDRYQLDNIMPIEYYTKYWQGQQARYQYQYLSPAQRNLILAQASNQKAQSLLAGINTRNANFQYNWMNDLNYQLKRAELGLKRNKGQNLRNFGTENLSDIKFLGLPVGGFSQAFKPRNIFGLNYNEDYGY